MQSKAVCELTFGRELQNEVLHCGRIIKGLPRANALAIARRQKILLGKFPRGISICLLFFRVFGIIDKKITIKFYEVRIMPKIAVKKLDENAVLPTYASAYAAGADLYALSDCEITFAPGETKLIRTGLAMEIPEGYAGLIYARSGLASKRGLAPANKVGVVDADYRGEVMVALHNHSEIEQKIAPKERIAQLVVAPFLKADYFETDELSETVRGVGGFGSTGRK